MPDKLPAENQLQEQTPSAPVILAADTSSLQASLAVVRGDVLLASVTDQSGRTHSQTFFENLDWLLRQANLTLAQVDGFAVTTGPGSFTGLRVGMAAIKGLAHTLERPALGVTTIDAWALTPGVSGNVAVMIEAMRGEVFCGKREVRIEDGEILLSNPDQDFAAAPEIALARIIASWRDHAVIFVGSGAVRYQEMMAREATEAGLQLQTASSATQPAFQSAPQWQLVTDLPALASFVAMAAVRWLDSDHPPGVQAFYLRPADAELKFPKLDG